MSPGAQRLPEGAYTGDMVSDHLVPFFLFSALHSPCSTQTSFPRLVGRGNATLTGWGFGRGSERFATGRKKGNFNNHGAPDLVGSL